MTRFASSALHLYFGGVEPSYTTYSMLLSSLKGGNLERKRQKHFGLYADGLHTHNKCCTIAVLFFVFGEVMLSIKAAISPSLYVAIDNRVSSAAKLCVAAFVSFASAIFLSRLRFCRFLVLGSISGFFDPFGKLYLYSKQKETSVFTLIKTCGCFWHRAPRQRV